MPRSQRGADIRRELARRAAAQAAPGPAQTPAAEPSAAAKPQQSRRKRPTKKEH